MVLVLYGTDFLLYIYKKIQKSPQDSQFQSRVKITNGIFMGYLFENMEKMCQKSALRILSQWPRRLDGPRSRILILQFSQSYFHKKTCFQVDIYTFSRNKHYEQWRILFMCHTCDIEFQGGKTLHSTQVKMSCRLRKKV